MQAFTSFPPNPYDTPSWVAAMNLNQCSAPTSPMRPIGLGRSTSRGGYYAYTPAPTLGRTSSARGYADDGNGALSDRPSEWRKDYSAHSGLGALLQHGMQRSSSSVGDGGHHRLHKFIRHSSSKPPITWDLRTQPRTLTFRDVQRETVSSDLMRFACEPPVLTMRLIHRCRGTLTLPITQRDFWNEEMGGKEREKIASAWRERCGIDAGERASGVRRVDYLRRDVIFEGLVKGRNGTWEMKTRKLVMGN
ncbi:hypothetical protein FIBSPDRAFT_868539 [Athelia psychrophila]|uniref:DUF6699 domain-containing protein n=1 Tax=Athelia psychrophila TaxID=1759441 RepID=A0A166CZK5_9AGAM|nr:hypothetical protein FIBSPDRAFT_868539 [Fibularhizoctonia sp. CBS 109695]